MTGRYRILFLTLAGTVCLGGFAQTTPIEPQTFYVDAAYSGPEAGTSDKPYTRISAALAQAFPGRQDNIVVRTGTYTESVFVPVATILRSEEGAAHVFVQGESGTLVRLDNGAILRGITISGTSGAAVNVLSGAAAEVSNCVLQGSGTGLLVNSNAQVRCVNNTVDGNGTGIRCESGGSIAPFANNSITNNVTGVSTAPAVTLSSQYNAFFKNETAYAGAFVPGDHDFVSNPLYVDPDHLNFHLRRISNLRDGGDPDAAFRDVDGTRNDVGADGGPQGAVDLLAPQIHISTNPAPAQGSPPLAVFADASASADEWGIDSWEWDTNPFNGLTFGDGTGDSLPFLFSEPGGYLVYLRVTDNSGVSSVASFPVRVGAPPQVVRLQATPGAGPAPLSVAFDMEAVSLIGGSLAYAWDFDGDGSVDSTEQNPSFTFPESTPPGFRRVSLVVADEDGVLTQVLAPITISAHPVAASVEVKPGVAAELNVADSQSPLDGLQILAPAGVFSEKTVLAVSEVNADAFPFTPSGTILSLFDLAPGGILLSQAVTVEAPVSGIGLTESNVKVAYWDSSSQAWFDAGITRTRVKDGAVSFDTSHFSTFIILRTDAAGGPCFIATAAYGTPLAGEIGVLRALRDDHLLTNTFGTALADGYYRMSPPLADLVARHPVLASFVRLALWPLIAALRYPLLNVILLLPLMAGLRRLRRAA